MGVELPLISQEPVVRRSAGTRVRPSRRQRLTGLGAALLIEGLVVLALLTLGRDRLADMARQGEPLKTFDLAAPQPEPVVPVKQPETKVVTKTPPVTQPRPVEEQVAPAPETPAPTPPAPQPAPLVQLSRDELAGADLRSLPATPRPVARAGPPGPSAAADTPLVDGTGPNGEKLYAAAWQREPSDGEMRGYLSTAQPGVALIACKTVANFKVDECVSLGEMPRGSQLARAVLAAAWQFRVLPPRIGGRYQVGEWVRIRFEYSLRARAAWEK